MENFLRDGVDFQIISSKAMSSVGDAHFFEDSTPPLKIRQFLDSSKEFEKLKGMKWLLAMLSKGRDVSEFFPDVVKNVVVKSVEVKKMVYLYLVHYADYDATCREISLLSINSFQKDMSGTNPLIRGLALRVMTSIRVADLIQLQLLAVRKCAGDSSPYVRKCAATALTKIYALDTEQLIHLKQIMSTLLKDSQTMVLGSVMASFNEICPTSYEILHKSYRKLCHLLADMDEWTQILTLEVMCRYVRNQFTDPAPGVSAAVKLQAKQRSASAVKGRIIGNTVKRKVVRKAFYSDEEDELDEEEVEIDNSNNHSSGVLLPERGSVFSALSAAAVVGGEGEGNLDPDHRLILRSSQPLLKSRNSGVVLGVCMLHYYCGSHNTSITQQIGKSLVRILRDRREIQYVVLNSINTMAHERPSIFKAFLSEFFIKASDPIFNRLLKLEILTSICTKENIQTILREFQIYIKHTNIDFVCATIRAIGRVADVDTSIAPNCMTGLMNLIYSTRLSAHTLNERVLTNKNNKSSSSGSSSNHSNNPTSSSSLLFYSANLNTTISTAELPSDRIIEESVVVLRQLVQQNPSSDKNDVAYKTLQQLIKLLIMDDTSGMSGGSSSSSNNGKLYQPKARASIIWLIGEFYEMVSKVAIDILRITAKGFINEHTETKQQIVNMAVKLSLRLPENETVQTLMTYVLELARYDTDTDLRDRSRVLTAMMGLAPSTDENEDEGGSNISATATPLDEESLAELAEHGVGILLAAKLPPVTLVASLDVEGIPSFNLGSLSSLVGHYASGYEPLCPWPEFPPDATVRDTIRLDNNNSHSGSGSEDEREGSGNRGRDPRGAAGGINKGFSGGEGGKDVKGFYGDDDSSDSDSDSSDDDSDNENSDDDSSDSGSDSNDDDDDDDEEEEEEESNDDDSDDSSDSDSDSGTDAPVTRIPLNQPIPSSSSSQHKHQPSQSHSQQSLQTTHTQQQTLVTRGAPIRRVQVTTSGESKHSSSGMNKKGVVKDVFAAGDNDLLNMHSNSPVKSSSSFNTTTNNNHNNNNNNMNNNNDIFNSMSSHQQHQPVVAVSQSASLIDSVFSNDLMNMSMTSGNNESAPVPLLHSVVTPSAAGAYTQSHSSLPPQQQQSQPQPQYAKLSLSMPMNVAPGHHNNKTNSSGRLMMTPPSGQQQQQQQPYMQPFQQQQQQQFMSPHQQQQQFQQQQQQSFASSNNNANMTSSVAPVFEESLSETKVILKPELAGGLSVTLRYRHNAMAVAYSGAHCAYIIIQNLSDHPLRRIKVSFPSDVRCTKLDDIQHMSPGQSIVAPIELVLAGAVDRQIRVDIRCDAGSYTGLYTPYAYELIMPYKMSVMEFDALRKRLIGLTEVKKYCPLTSWGVSLTTTGGSGASDTSEGEVNMMEMEIQILEKIQKLLNIYIIQGAGVGELMLAGLCRKGFNDERVLITVITNSSSSTTGDSGGSEPSTLLRINCEDPVLCTSLLDVFAKLFTRNLKNVNIMTAVTNTTGSK